MQKKWLKVFIGGAVAEVVAAIQEVRGSYPCGIALVEECRENKLTQLKTAIFTKITERFSGFAVRKFFTEFHRNSNIFFDKALNLITYFNRHN